VVFSIIFGNFNFYDTATLDGSNATILLSAQEGSTKPQVQWPNHITIDLASNKGKYNGSWSPNPNLYFLDAGHHYIVRTNFDFTEFYKIFTNVDHPYSMAIFEEYIYFTEWKAPAPGVYRISKYCDDHDPYGIKCEAEPMSQTLTYKPMSMIILNPFLQPELQRNPCEMKPCRKGALCLLRPNGSDGVARTCIGKYSPNMKTVFKTYALKVTSRVIR